MITVGNSSVKLVTPPSWTEMRYFFAHETSTGCSTACFGGVDIHRDRRPGSVGGVCGPQRDHVVVSGGSLVPAVGAERGTDDYHCTLVNPHVPAASMITSSQFFPESPEVHHAILFLVPPGLARQAQLANVGGKGWTCFGETPLAFRVETTCK